jgi:hypothetical protein
VSISVCACHNGAGLPHYHVHLDLIEDHGDHFSRIPVDQDPYDIKLVVDWHQVARELIRSKSPRRKRK